MVRLSLIFLPLVATASAFAVAQTPQRAAPAPAAWTPAQTQEILARTQTIRLAPNVSHLSAGERVAVQKLIEVGRIFQDVYEDQRHPQALTAEAGCNDARQSPRPVPASGRTAARQECLSARSDPAGI
jgi:hypothetical protein